MTEEKQNEWIEWTGGECPVDPRALHDRKYRDGRASYRIECERTTILRRAIWGHDGVDEDIIAYRICSALASTDRELEA